MTPVIATLHHSPTEDLLGRRTARSGDAPRLLLVKLADLGDAVIVSTALNATRETLPEFEVDLLLGSAGAPLYVGDARVRRVHSFDRRLIEGCRVLSPLSLYAWGRLLWALRRERYEVVILAHHLTTLLGALKLASAALATGATVRAGLDNGRGWFLNRRVPDRGFGVKREGEYWTELVSAVAGRESRTSPSLAIQPAALRSARALLEAERATRPLIALHHGLGGWIPSRGWTVEGFAQVAALLHERTGGTVLLVGGPEEREAAQAVGGLSGVHTVVLAGRTDVPTLVALLSLCDVFVGTDTGVMHVAAAVGVPVVSLWGPTNEAAWGPLVSPGGNAAVCLRAPDRPTPWVYVGRSMGDVRRPSDLGSLDPCVVAEAALNILKEVDR